MAWSVRTSVGRNENALILAGICVQPKKHCTLENSLSLREKVSQNLHCNLRPNRHATRSDSACMVGLYQMTVRGASSRRAWKNGCCDNEMTQVNTQSRWRSKLQTRRADRRIDLIYKQRPHCMTYVKQLENSSL